MVDPMLGGFPWMEPPAMAGGEFLVDFGASPDATSDTNATTETAFTITLLTKAGGPLTKRIYLADNGELVSDGSACVMGRGRAERVHLHGLGDLATLIGALDCTQAIALGALRSDQPGDVEIITADARSKKYNGSAPPGVITRTLDYFSFAKGQPGLLMIDIDFKGMSDHVRQHIETSGGVQAVLQRVLPELGIAGWLIRASTSAGLYHAITAERYPSSGGLHIYMVAADAADIPRFLTAMHQRLWLAGFGWGLIGKAGAFLERSLVDVSVGSPERLAFEGPPVTVPPIMQDMAARAPQVRQGPPIDTRAICPDLTDAERDEYRKRITAERKRLAPEMGEKRGAFIATHTKAVAVRTGMSEKDARRVVEQQVKGTLLPSVLLEWDSDEFSGCTVADILADPERFIGATLADPIEGVAYGRGKAKVLRDRDGGVRVHSFAHGLRTNYRLRHDPKQTGEGDPSRCAETERARLI